MIQCSYHYLNRRCLLNRTKRLVVLLDQEEAKAIGDLVVRERLPTSTFVRRLLLQEIDRRGIPLDRGEQGREVEPCTVTA